MNAAKSRTLVLARPAVVISATLVWVLLAVLTSATPALAVELKVMTDKGQTTVIYNGQQVFAGTTSGNVTAKTAVEKNVEYAAAFDDDRVIWENMPGAGKHLGSKGH